MKKRSLYSICRNDIFLAAAFALAAVLLLLLFFTSQNGTNADTVVITIDGQKYEEYSLDKDQTITIDNERGKNVIQIINGTVMMIEADCPDGYCISKGSISRNGNTIVCLPHRLVVEIKLSKQEEDDIDIIAK